MNQLRWPSGEPSQIDYEALREMVLAGITPCSVAAARFWRRGLAGLIAWRAPEAALVASVVGIDRPAWTPGGDPRLVALADAFGLLARAGCETAGDLEWGELRA